MKQLVKILLGAVIAIGVLLIVASVWAGQQIKSMTPEQAAQALQDSAPPKFNLRGLMPKLTLADAKSQRLVNGCKTQDSTTWCDLTDPVVAGTHSLDTFVTFEKGAFKSIVVTFTQWQFEKVSDALTNAYGKTCRFDVKDLQNSFGAQFNSIDATWCFDGGELEFLQRSRENFRESVLVYAPYEPQEDSKEFTPDKL